jgi:hypothetical protein
VPALLQAQSDGKSEMPVSSLGLRAVAHVYPDHPLHSALPYLYEWPLVAVAHRARPDMLQGILSLKNALKAYRQAAREEAD